MAEEFPKEPSDELKQFESLLRGCSPAAIRIDRDRLMYSAGQASVTGDVATRPTGTLPLETCVNYKSFAWPLATAALLLLSLTLGAASLFRTTEVRVVYVPQPASGSSAEFVSLPATEGLQPAAARET